MNKSKCIAFTKPETAELLYRDIPKATEPGDVAVKMEYTVVSGGTEKANIMGSKNTGTIWPRYLGYCGVGHVIQVPLILKIKL